jgi:gliding motility-associated-like protein
VDDRYSRKLDLTFPFCFYGNTYTKAIIGSNSVLTFDTTNEAKWNSWPQTTSGGTGTRVPIPYNGGTQNSSTSTYYPRASVMGVFHDVYPPNVLGGNRKIEWRVEGTAPHRRFIASYNKVQMFSCSSLSATHQMVIYEGTNIIEVYVQDKPVCNTWNRGLATLGIQNFERTKAVAAPGKNASVWGTMNMKEAYRFTPSGGASLFKSAELQLNGVTVATADTASGSAGQLNISFPNICPTADSNVYIMKVTYGTCGNISGDVSFTDTVFVNKRTPSVSLSAQNATCSGGGSIEASASGGQGPLQFSLNGGAYQASQIFNGLVTGDYDVSVKNNYGCVTTATINVPLTNDLTLSVMSDTAICPGTSFTAAVQSNAVSFSWAPSFGLSNASAPNPVITQQMSLKYEVKATTGPCTAIDSLEVAMLPMPHVFAGFDQTIITGDAIELMGSGSAGTYQWTPLQGVTAGNTLTPTVAPPVTTTYSLNITNAAGCTISDDVTVNVLPYCVKPMEAFSPNGDGINELWLVTTGSCLRKAKAQVFNRYGHKVFESADYHNTWNGTFNGKPLPDGTYYFILSYDLINGKTVYLKGNVTILR